MKMHGAPSGATVSVSPLWPLLPYPGRAGEPEEAVVRGRSRLHRSVVRSALRTLALRLKGNELLEAL